MSKTKTSAFPFLLCQSSSFYRAQSQVAHDGPGGLPVREPRDAGDPAKGGRLNRAIVIVLALAVLALLLFLSFAVLVPKPGGAFTEFYVLGPDGKAGNYPAMLHLGDSAQVIVGIANHEHRDVAYDLVVALTDSVNVEQALRGKRHRY